ncbi:MAG: HAMP domain-containing sensor histidine kinase [Saprospiraceae bacterium]
MGYKRLLTLMIMIYMAAALTWWSILLHQQNQEIYRLEQQIQARTAGKSYDPEILHRNYRRKSAMILGEGLVFIAILGIGLYLINRSYFRELAVANQKRNFLLSITHELKSPITAIRLALDTIRTRPLKEEHYNTLIDGAIKENNRLEKLIKNLLLAAEVEASYGMEPEAVDLNALIVKARDSFQFNFPEVAWELDLGDLPTLWADKNDMDSVIYNLIENAIKYQKDPKRVKIRTSTTPENIMLEVTDLGDGIPDKERKLIFDKFYRIGSEATRKSSGTGLGLYIVKKILDRHQGHIQVLANEPRGTRFLLAFPNVLEQK